MAEFIDNNELQDDEVLLLELTDEDGNTTEFEYLDTVAYDGEEYVVLIENVEDADGVIILKIESIDDETENYVGIDDEELLDTVYNIFREAHIDDFDFTD